MKKNIIFLAIALCSFASISNARGPNYIEPIIDFSEGRYLQYQSQDPRTVSIANISIDRSELESLQKGARILPEIAAAQLGYYRGRVEEYFIVLKNRTVEQFVREAVTLAFEQSGHTVVSTGAASAEGVPSVDVKVSELWIWVEPISDSDRSRFNFSMTTELSSDDEQLASIGTVTVKDFRNGSRERSWKSYRNTIMHSMKAYIRDFASAVNKTPTT